MPTMTIRHCNGETELQGVAITYVIDEHGTLTIQVTEPTLTAVFHTNCWTDLIIRDTEG